MMKEYVVIISDNNIEYISALLDIWNDKNCEILIDWRWTKSKIIETLKDFKVKKCYVDYHFKPLCNNS